MFGAIAGYALPSDEFNLGNVLLGAILGGGVVGYKALTTWYGQWRLNCKEEEELQKQAEQMRRWPHGDGDLIWQGGKMRAGD